MTSERLRQQIAEILSANLISIIDLGKARKCIGQWIEDHDEESPDYSADSAVGNYVPLELAAEKRHGVENDPFDPLKIILADSITTIALSYQSHD